MPPRQPLPFDITNGYLATQNGFVKGTIFDGLNVWFRGINHVESSKGFATNGTSGGVAVLTNVEATHGGISTSGNVVQAFAAGVYFGAGTGTMYVGGVSKGVLSGGSINIYVSSLSPAGLTSPGAPTIAATPALTGHNKGSYAIALTAIRSTTGGESTIGAPSNQLTVSNKAIDITALGTIDSKADKVGIYASKQNFPSGPFYHLYDVAYNSAGPTLGGAVLPYTIRIPGEAGTTGGWVTGQLGDLAPLDYNVPPACTFVAVANAVIIAVGAYGGSGLAASYPNKPEAYPTRFTAFIPGGATVTACKSSGIQGTFIVATGSSMNLVATTISSAGPLDIRQFWPTTGVNSGNQFCVYKETIYAYLGVRGAVRSSLYSDLNENAGHFAVNVQKAFNDNGFTPTNTIVAYDPVNAAIWYMSGTKGYPFMLDTEEWSPQQTLPATVTSAVTMGGQMLMQGAAGQLYSPELGTGTTWNFVPAFIDFSGVLATAVRLGGLVSGNVRLDILDNPNDLTHLAVGTGIPVNLTSTRARMADINVQNLPVMGIKASGTDMGGIQDRKIFSQVIIHPATV